MKKKLFYENPLEHLMSAFYEPVRAQVESTGRELKEARTVEEAFGMLCTNEFSHAVIHHSKAEDVRMFRKACPEVRYAALSQTLPLKVELGTLGEAMVKKLGEDYDFVVTEISGLSDFIKQ